MRRALLWLACAGALAAGCSSNGSMAGPPAGGSPDGGDASVKGAGGDGPEGGVTPDGGSGDAAGSADAMAMDGGSKAAQCTGTFGSALTAPYGRLDGTVLAIVAPTDQQCPMPNRTHVVVEVTAGGATYRMVTNVHSDRDAGDNRVDFLSRGHALPPPAWSEGWHTPQDGIALDYPTTLGVHSGDFSPLDEAPLVATVEDAIAIGAKVSVYASTSGGASAHLVHRVGNNQDGAIVLDPDGPSPTFLLFHFSDQTF